MTYLKHIASLLLALLVFSIASVNATESITYIHTDHLGSPIAATNEDGSVKWTEDYQPFGVQRTNQDSDNTTGFTGHQHDDALELTYMQARWYHPEVGRFMALDPIVFRTSNLQSFGRYTYGNNNPYRYIDPDGKAPCPGFSRSKCMMADGNYVISKSNVVAGSTTDKVAKENIKTFEVPSGLEETAGYIDGEKAVVARDTKTKVTSKVSQAEFDLPSSADAIIHGHPDQDLGGFSSPGDGTAVINSNKPNYTVSQGRVGVTELADGKLRFRVIKGRFNGTENKFLQRNLNKQQQVHGVEKMTRSKVFLQLLLLCLANISCKANDFSEDYIVFVGKPVEVKVSNKTCFDIIEVKEGKACLGYVTELKYDIYNVLLGQYPEESVISFYNISQGPAIPNFVTETATYFILKKEKGGLVIALNKSTVTLKDEKSGYSQWVCGQNILIDSLLSQRATLKYKENSSEYCPVGVPLQEIKAYYEHFE